MLSARQKIARADKHLDAFNRKSRAWGDSDPFVITRESNADGSHHVFRLTYRTDPDLWGFAVLLGDALHNLRGGLDHAVYALAVAETGKNPPNDEATLAFPICSEPRFFEQARWRIKSLSDPVQTAIERLQPYNRLKPGKWFMPLWWLSRLHDVDKHRLSHIATVGTVPDEIVIDAEPGTYRALWNTAPSVGGTPILWLTLTEPNPNVYVDLKMTGGVILNIEGPRPVRPFTIYWITKWMRREVAIACRYLALHLPDTLPSVPSHPALRIEELAPGLQEEGLEG
jgi:hypothetical protein